MRAARYPPQPRTDVGEQLFSSRRRLTAPSATPPPALLIASSLSLAKGPQTQSNPTVLNRPRFDRGSSCLESSHSASMTWGGRRSTTSGRPHARGRQRQRGGTPPSALVPRGAANRGDTGGMTLLVNVCDQLSDQSATRDWATRVRQTATKTKSIGSTGSAIDPQDPRLPSLGYKLATTPCPLRQE